MMQQDNLAEELRAVLLRLAAGQLTLTEWQAWWVLTETWEGRHS